MAGIGHSTRARRTCGVLALLVLASFPPAARAAVPFQDVASSGPLTHVYLGNELSCQISYAGDSNNELFPPAATPGDCGTFVAVGGVLFAPNFAQHGPSGGNTATSSLGSYTPFTAVSQTPVSGDGSSGSPFRVTTVADVGTTGLRITQIDQYVTGQESYRTDVTVANTSSSSKDLILYRAGDCYLQESDTGYGFTESPSAVGCSKNANNSPAGRIEEWFPITSGNTYLEAGYSGVWSAIGAKAPFANTCLCDTAIDQGAGIAWSATVAAGSQKTFAHYTRFSPSGTIGPPPSVAPPSQPPSGDPNDSVTPGQVITLPPNRRCVSRRNFRIRLKRPNGVTLIAARVNVNGRQVAVVVRKQRYRTLRGKVLKVKRLTAQVDLRGLPKGRFTVEIRAVTKTLKILKGKRRYRTCTGKRKGSGGPL